MPNWNLQGLNFYRDRFLVSPVLLFSVLATANILAPESPGDRLYGLKLAACALVAVLLAKERLIVVLAAAGVIALESPMVLVATRDWKGYGPGFLIAAGTIVALLPIARRWKPSPEEPRNTRKAALLFVMAGLVAAAAVVLLLKPKWLAACASGYILRWLDMYE
jgi:hypothetical protein